MDDQRGEKMEEIMLPGFRFHPTDEELVGFYLKRKIQERPFTIELIKQLDIYKYDPWDLPKLATTTGEKEWYFYCPRDRKYRNSTRPNRVTGAGFWKATGTDRPIYSEGGSKCIGLKKSLVFYKGRAAKGAKTDWMMHEFRLPALSDPKRFLDKPIPANDLWAICRIFKKTNTTAQRAMSQSWVSPLPETTVSNSTMHQFGYDQNMSSSFAPKPNVVSPMLDPCSSYYTDKSNINPLMASPYQNGLDFSSSTFMLPSSTVDASSILLNMSSSVLGGFGRQEESTGEFGGSYSSSQDDHHCNNINGLVSLNEMQVPSQGNDGSSSEEINDHGSMKMMMNHGDEQQWIGFPMSDLPLVSPHGEAWKSSLVWDAYSPCPTEISISYPSTKCYT